MVRLQKQCIETWVVEVILHIMCFGVINVINNIVYQWSAWIVLSQKHRPGAVPCVLRRTFTKDESLHEPAGPL